MPETPDLWGFEFVNSIGSLGASPKCVFNPRVLSSMSRLFEGDGQIDGQKRFSNIQRILESSTYQWPELGGHAELDSLKAHTQYFKHSYFSEKPTNSELDLILDFCEKIFVDCKIDVTNWFSKENFIKCLRELDFQSSPGFPYLKEKPTIGEWLGFNGFNFDEIQVERLWSDVLFLECSDNMENILWRSFIKLEPHKAKKAQLKRWRLIMCPPLHLQMLWQMAFSMQNLNFIENAYRLPTQQGIILCGGDWKHYYTQWISDKVLCGADKTAWDWTMPEWMIRLCFRLRQRLIFGFSEKWNRVAAKLYDGAFGDEFKVVLSNGEIYRQTHYGVMKSGCVNTISDNSMAQVFLHVLVSIRMDISVYPLVRSCGDDTLQAKQHLQDLSQYTRFGFLIKSVSDTLEFVGHEFKDSGPVPMYLQKHLFKIQYQNEELLAETLDSYLRLYVNDLDIYDFWKKLAYVLGFADRVGSDDQYWFWYHNPLSRDKRLLKILNK